MRIGTLIGIATRLKGEEVCKTEGIPAREPQLSLTRERNSTIALKVARTYSRRVRSAATRGVATWHCARALGANNDFSLRWSENVWRCPHADRGMPGLDGRRKRRSINESRFKRSAQADATQKTILLSCRDYGRRWRLRLVPAAVGQVSAEHFESNVDTPVKPWTHLNFYNDPKNFKFAIVSDRTGGVRPGRLCRRGEEAEFDHAGIRHERGRFHSGQHGRPRAAGKGMGRVRRGAEAAQGAVLFSCPATTTSTTT